MSDSGFNQLNVNLIKESYRRTKMGQDAQEQKSHLLYNLKKTINLTLSPGESEKERQSQDTIRQPGHFNMKTLHMSDLQSSEGLKDSHEEIKQYPTNNKHIKNNQNDNSYNSSANSSPLRIKKGINQTKQRELGKPQVQIAQPHTAQVGQTRTQRLHQEGQSQRSALAEENLSGVRDKYQEYIKNKFNKKRNDNNNKENHRQENRQLLQEIANKQEKRVAENETITALLEEQSVSSSIDYMSLRKKQTLIQKAQQQYEEFQATHLDLSLFILIFYGDRQKETEEQKISGQELKGKLKDIMEQIRQAQLNKYISNPLDISFDQWNKLESQEDFFQIFQKIKENMIQLSQKCSEQTFNFISISIFFLQEETIDRQTSTITSLEQSLRDAQDINSSSNFQINSLKEQLNSLQLKHSIDLDKINKEGQESIIKLQAQLENITEKTRKIQVELRSEVERLESQNTLLIEKLRKGKEKYDKVCDKYRQLSTSQRETKSTLGGLIKTVSHYNLQSKLKQFDVSFKENTSVIVNTSILLDEESKTLKTTLKHQE